MIDYSEFMIQEVILNFKINPKPEVHSGIGENIQFLGSCPSSLTA
jgi:hypothetical protein